MMKPLRIAIGADHLGLALKEELLAYLLGEGFAVDDFGVHDGEETPYPDIGHRVACAVQRGAFDRGILVCGTGIGMCITANKVPGIRAAVCHDLHSAERSRMSNGCQVMALGAQLVGADFARLLVSVWLQSDFQYGRSTSKVARICELEGLAGTPTDPLVTLRRFG
jgi:ribose 5-phosphate isomerase B